MRIFQPTVTGSNTTTGSLHISGPVYFYTLETSSTFHVLTYNTSSGQVFFTGSDAFKGVPDDPLNSIQFNYSGNFSGSSNLTFDNNVVYLTGSLNTSGSITLTGSMFVSGAISASSEPGTASFYGTASWALNAITASYALTASFATNAAAAPEDTYIQYNSGGFFGAEEHFRYIYTSNSFQQGSGVNAIGAWSHAQGAGTIAAGRYSHAEGNASATGTTLGYSASINSGVVELWSGYGNESALFNPGDYLFITEPDGGGGTNISVAIDSVTHGTNTLITLIDTSINLNPAIVGNVNIPPGTWGGDQIGGGQQSHAEGQNSYALAWGAHVEGINNVVAAEGAHVEGIGNIAVGQNQMIIGAYNALNTGSGAFIIGDGDGATRHNLLFASQSWFEVSASNTFLQGLPYLTSSYVLTYDSASGQVYFASSSTLEVSPFPFTGSAGITGSIELTGSMFVSGAISASFGENTVGFYGTASWAVNSSTASYLLNPYPINFTGSSLYSIAPVAGIPSDITISPNSIWFGENAGLSVGLTALNTIFLGQNAGYNTWYSDYSNFIGNGAGANIPTDAYNSNFIGLGAGAGSNYVYSSNFIGGGAGSGIVTNGHESNFIGVDAGSYTEYSYHSNFLGYQAGYAASNAYQANFVGYQAGWSASGATTSTFIGYQAGYWAKNALISNFIGWQAGYSASSANYSIFIGNESGWKASNANNSQFIGWQAGYSASYADFSQFIGSQAGFEAKNADNSNFIGKAAGFSASNANDSNFIGWNAGYYSTDAEFSNFIGTQAGYKAINANRSNFLGYDAGYTASNAGNSNFLGTFAGKKATNANNSNFLGNSAGIEAINASNSNFFGNGAGVSASNASGSNFIGASAGYQAVNAAYSTLIGFQAGFAYSSSENSIGPNNIIIGTNLTLEPNRRDAINIGGIIFGTGSHSDINLVSPFSGSADGKIGINITHPTYSFHASGSISFPSLTSASQTNVLTYNSTTGQLFYTASNALSVTSTPLTIKDEGNFITDTPSFLNFTGSGVSASISGGGVNVYIPGGGAAGNPAPSDTYIQYNENDSFGAEQYFRYIYNSHSLQQGDNNIIIGQYSHAEGNTTQVGWKALTASSIVNGLIEIYDGVNYTSKFTGNKLILGSTSANKVYTWTSKGYSAPTFSIQLSDTSVNDASVWKYLIGSFNTIQGTSSLGLYSHAEGLNTQAIGDYSHAEGFGTQAVGWYSHTEGNGNVASGVSSHAEGNGTTTYGDYSHTEGNTTTAYGDYSHTEGNGTTTYGDYSHTEGNGTTTYGDYSHTEGNVTTAGWKAITASSIVNGLIEIYDGVNYTNNFGNNNTNLILGSTSANKVYKFTSKSFNAPTFSLQLYDTSINGTGTWKYLIGINDTTEGHTPLGLYAHAEGNSNNAIGDYSHAEGFNNQAIGWTSHAEGIQTKAIGNYSHAEGVSTQAIGTYSHAEGGSTQAIGNYSHAEGQSTIAGYKAFTADLIVSGTASFYNDIDNKYTNEFTGTEILIGGNYYTFRSESYSAPTYSLYLNDPVTITSNRYVVPISNPNSDYADQDTFYGDYSHTEGRNNYALGAWSHAEGYLNYAIGNYSHVEGTENRAIGDYSYANGRVNKAVSDYSFVLGRNNEASSSYTLIGGLQNTSSGIYQTIVGQNSTQISSQSAFIVGGGWERATRYNSFVVIPETQTGDFLSDAIIEMRVHTASISASNLYITHRTASLKPNIYIQYLTQSNAAQNVLTYNSTTGQIFYTASSAIGGGGGGGGDITGVTAGLGLSGGGDTGAVTLTLDTSSAYFIAGVSASAAASGFGSGGNFNSTSSIIGNGLSSSFNINHGFNTRNLHITVYESSSNGVTGNGETVYPDIRRINVNTASIIFANPPSASQYIVYISQ
jgi:hypothetical protein